MSSGEYMYAFLLSIYPKVKLLGHRVCVWFALVDTTHQFSRVVVLVQPLNLNFQND